MDNYAPLVGFWGARGFAVIQPTHLDSLNLAPDGAPGEGIADPALAATSGTLERIDSK